MYCPVRVVNASKDFINLLVVHKKKKHHKNISHNILVFQKVFWHLVLLKFSNLANTSNRWKCLHIAGLYYCKKINFIKKKTQKLLWYYPPVFFIIIKKITRINRIINQRPTRIQGQKRYKKISMELRIGANR